MFEQEPIFEIILIVSKNIEEKVKMNLLFKFKFQKLSEARYRSFLLKYVQNLPVCIGPPRTMKSVLLITRKLDKLKHIEQCLYSLTERFGQLGF